MGDTKMFSFFSNVSTINAFVREIVFYGIWTVVDLCMGVSDVSLAFLCWLCVIFSVKGKSGCSAVRVRRKGARFEF